MFFFLSLAFAKRYSELIAIEDAGEAHISGRGYEVRDLRVIESVGPSSGYLAVLVFCNYLSDAHVTRLYPHPQVLWLVAPVLLYWITRIWFIARRRKLDDDPIVFAIRDRRSYVCGILAAAGRSDRVNAMERLATIAGDDRQAQMFSAASPRSMHAQE